MTSYHPVENVAAVLKDYTQASIALVQLLRKGADFTELDRLTLENNLAIVQLYYAVWMRELSKNTLSCEPPIDSLPMDSRNLPR
jgi:hypothetical protein